MDTPLVTILIPSYNRATYIEAALQSVLQQSYSNWELLFLDDASTDDTKTVVGTFATNEPRIHYICQPKNIGSTKNRNIGIEKAHGKYIAILDSDDIWLDPRKLEKQISFLEHNPTYAVVGTYATTIDNSGKQIGEIKLSLDDTSIRQHILRRHQFVHSSVVFSRQAAMSVGSYNTLFTIADDFDFILAIAKKYKMANLPEFTTAYRIHEGSLTKNKRNTLVREHLAIIKKYHHEYPGYWTALLKSYLRILFT